MTNSPTYNQSSALNEIVTWSEKQPEWQRDALRQLISGVELQEINVDRLEAICIGECNEFVPLDKDHVTRQNSNGEAVTLSKLHSLNGINALATNQELNFSTKGVTIVYGDNGSGKSGYCRVLKHACRSRDGKNDILSNIDEDDSRQQTATIDYAIGSTPWNVLWKPETEQMASLSQISIFDARSANTHVQAENNVAYTPFPMRVLEDLGELCDDLKQRIDNRGIQIQEKTPLSISEHQLNDLTSAGKFIEELSDKSDTKVLSLLCELSAEEQRRLENLRNDLSQDPQKVILALGAQKKRLDEIITAIELLNSSISSESISNYNTLLKKYSTAKETSNLASQELFSASPLPQIDSEAWRTLWEAARRFSDDIVYTEKQFPAPTANSDLCVLCQQTLGEKAIKRLETFEKFVKSTTKAKEQSCLNDLNEQTKTLKETSISEQALSAAHLFLQDELSLSEQAETLSNWVKAANTKLCTLITQQELYSLDQEFPKDTLCKLAHEFMERIQQAKDILDPEKHELLINQKQNLEDRISLDKIRNDVEAEIGRLKQLANLKSKAKTTKRAAITNKNKELSDLLVTASLRDRFAREITKLELNTTPMELKKTRDRKAQSLFRVEFIGYPGQPLGEILSEGEHRCVALAAFLAELVTSKDYSSIVFDDPMSSLDHIYRERVAKRLTEEAMHRQVVIFTHDLGFLFEVIREAENNNVSLYFQHVKRRDKIPGYITNDLPLKAKTAPALVAALRNELKEIKGQFDTVSEARRVILTKGIIEQLREAWDQVIADFIAPVLGRFDNKIKGNSLFKLLKLSQDDVKLITEARGRLSEDMHNAAGALNPEEVSHDQLETEVNIIHDFIQEMKNRPHQGKPRIYFS